MDSQDSSRFNRFGLEAYILAVAILWTIIIAASLAWNIDRIRRNTLEQARIQARVAYEKDIAYRRWNTMHGGVYVKVTEQTPPNPYLELIPERDVTTTDGTPLTLINPAYMTRQAYDVAKEEYDVKGHLSSRDPLRPGNAPDEWEHEALKALERGAEEISSVVTLDSDEYMRLMRPLITEEGCIRCHPGRGLSIGDIQGGISVAVSMKPLREIEQKDILNLSLAHGTLWLLGLLGHSLGTKRLVRSERERRQAEEDTKKYARDLEESNRLKSLFIDIMRHDLLNPSGVIKCYVGYLLERETDPKKRELCLRIDQVNNKLSEMIENVSKYSRLEEMEQIECSRQDLNTILRESILLAKCQAEEGGMKISYRTEGEFPAWVNPMIGDVFLNLISNAVKYAPQGKVVEIDMVDGGSSWNVYVKDFGPGISDENKPKIFNRFERLAKEGVKGTGLGLAIAKRLVDLHHGRIWVEDNPRGGCVFSVSVPKEAPATIPEEA